MMILTLALLLQDPSGTLIIAGGGAVPDGVRAKALELAGGKSARVIIIPQASQLGEPAVEAWKADIVEVLDLEKKPVEQVQRANLIWIGGGDQNRLMKALAGTGVIEAIRKRYRDGAVVGGTSAGAAVMSKIMITGGGDSEVIRAGSTETAEGLGLWPKAIVDQHFVKRKRFNRLASAVLDHPELTGVGIDESTAVIVRGKKVEVVGESVVVLLTKSTWRVYKSGDTFEVP